MRDAADRTGADGRATAETRLADLALFAPDSGPALAMAGATIPARSSTAHAGAPVVIVSHRATYGSDDAAGVPGLSAGSAQRTAREPVSTASSPRLDSAIEDWGLVRAFRQQVADQLAKEVERRDGLSEQAQRDLGRVLIGEVIQGHADALMTRGVQVFDAAQERALATAVFDAMFGLGRLQPLVDDPEVENIEITGCDQVWLQFADGRIEPGPPVADSDEDLIGDLQFLAAHGGAGERPFSSAHPTLDLQLHDGSRLAAMAWTSSRPAVTIRRHRYVDVDLARLEQLGMLDGAVATFLSAAVRAGRSIVISGLPGAGKTTLVRALANELPPLERLCTIETEYELLLHQLPDRHHRIVAMQSRPGSGERTADGREVGAVSLDQLVHDSLRHNVARIVVGEVRGKEILPMFKAMQAGRGSLCTTHAESARDAVERLATCALEAGPHITEGYAYRQIAQLIDLVVQVAVVDETPDGGRKHRYVAEVVHLERGEGPNGMSVTDIFCPGPDGRAVATGFSPAWVQSLAGVAR